MMTLRNPLSRVSSLFIVAVATCLALVPTRARGTVRGTVKMPDASRSTRLYHGYWRLENGNVPVQTAGGAKAETVVVLENVKGAHAPSARTITIELGGLDARPRLVITGPGSVIELKNTGKVRHELSTPDKPSAMPLETLTPGQTRRQRFDAIGDYVIRDSEYPHIMISRARRRDDLLLGRRREGQLLDRQRPRRQRHAEGVGARQVGHRAADRHRHRSARKS